MALWCITEQDRSRILAIADALMAGWPAGSYEPHGLKQELQVLLRVDATGQSERSGTEKANTSKPPGNVSEGQESRQER